jgi:hypothetical protein
MKIFGTLLAAALLSLGSAAHAVVLDFTDSGATTQYETSFNGVVIGDYAFGVTGSASSPRTFNSVVWGEYGFGIKSTGGEGVLNDLVNKYEVLTFTFTTPTMVNLSDVVFRKADGDTLAKSTKDYEYRVDSGDWTRKDLKDSPDFDPALGGTSFSFRYFANSGGNTSFYVSSLDVTPVAAIPEPETYALMIAGLGLVGFMARRRKVMQGASA